MARTAAAGPRAKAESFPQTVYVHREKEPNSDATFLTVGETTDDVEDGELVGEYELKQVWKKRVDHKLEPRQ